jgi:HEAT repeat protein
MPLIRREPANKMEPAGAVRQSAAVLRSGDVHERWQAARSLAAESEAAGILGEALATEHDARVREAIFTSLIRLGSNESVEAVIPHLRSNDPALRTAALDALREMINTVRPRLPALLADPDPDIRLLCCDLVRELSAADATDLLCGVLERDPEPNVCGAAIDVLAELGTPKALPALRKCAARYRDQGFLTFAIKLAAERIACQDTSS